MSKILVTGSSGVIGRELLHFLKGNEVLAVDREQPKEILEGITYLSKNIGIEPIQEVISFDPDIVFHLAASFERTEESPEFHIDNWNDNQECFHNISTHTMPKMFVFASSYLVYKDNYSNNTYYLDEKSEIDPRNICGASKYYCEKELEFIKKYINPSMNYINARIFRSFGKGSRDVISRWIRSVINDEEINVWNLNNSFDYIYAGDVAKYLFLLSKINNTVTVNIGNGRSVKISEIISVISNVKQIRKINYYNDKNEFNESTCADITLLKLLTGHSDNVNINDAISRIFEYEQYGK